MECKNHRCKYHKSRPMITSFYGEKISMVQGCKDCTESKDIIDLLKIG